MIIKWPLHLCLVLALENLVKAKFNLAASNHIFETSQFAQNYHHLVHLGICTTLIEVTGKQFITSTESVCKYTKLRHKLPNFIGFITFSIFTQLGEEKGRKNTEVSRAIPNHTHVCPIILCLLLMSVLLISQLFFCFQHNLDHQRKCLSVSSTTTTINLFLFLY